MTEQQLAFATTRAIERSDGHLYTYVDHEGRHGPWPGCTAICKVQDSWSGNDALLGWAVNLALDTVESMLVVDPARIGAAQDWQAIRSAAHQARNRPANEGIAAHEAVDRFNRGLPLELNPVTAPYVAQYASALRREGIVILGSEKYVVNPEIGFGGTYDSLVEIDGERGPLDIKSGKEKPSQRLQLAGLSMGLYHGEPGLEAEPMPELSGVGWILLLRPDGYTLVRHVITDEDRAHFIRLLDTYHAIRAWAKAFLPTVPKEEA